MGFDSSSTDEKKHVSVYKIVPWEYATQFQNTYSSVLLNQFRTEIIS